MNPEDLTLEVLDSALRTVMPHMYDDEGEVLTEVGGRIMVLYKAPLELYLRPNNYSLSCHDAVKAAFHNLETYGSVVTPNKCPKP